MKSIQIKIHAYETLNTDIEKRSTYKHTHTHTYKSHRLCFSISFNILFAYSLFIPLFTTCTLFSFFSRIFLFSISILKKMLFLKFHKQFQSLFVTRVNVFHLSSFTSFFTLASIQFIQSNSTTMWTTTSVLS